MKVVILAKTRMGENTCVGAVHYDTGEALRLIPQMNPAYHSWRSFKPKIGSIVTLTGRHAKPSELEPPHIEDFYCSDPLDTGQRIMNLAQWIEGKCNVAYGGVDQTFDARLDRTEWGRRFLSKGDTLPRSSVQFWRTPFALHYDSAHGSYSASSARLFEVKYKGVANAVPIVPAASLVRLSLSRFWKPNDAPAEEPRKSWLQLSGWYA